MALNERALLVHTSIGTWSGKKVSNRARKAAAEQLGSNVRAHESKKLLVDSVTLRNIHGADGVIRQTHYMYTLPWAENQRLLMAEAYEKYTDKLRGMKRQFELQVEQFVDEYPRLVAAAPTWLGSDFDAKDYPAQDEISRYFYVKTQFWPIPVQDFRISIPEEEKKKILEEIEQSTQAQLEEASKEPWRRAKVALENLRDKLQGYEPGKSRMHTSILTNLLDVIDTLPMLNVTEDPDLKLLEERLKASWGVSDVETTVDTWKENQWARSTEAANVENALVTFNEIFQRKGV